MIGQITDSALAHTLPPRVACCAYAGWIGQVLGVALNSFEHWDGGSPDPPVSAQLGANLLWEDIRTQRFSNLVF